MRFLIAVIMLAAATLSAHASDTLPLQTMIDAADDGAIINPPPGVYKGPVVITKPIVLDGRGKVTIDSGGKGTVIDILTNGVTIRRNAHYRFWRSTQRY